MLLRRMRPFLRRAASARYSQKAEGAEGRPGAEEGAGAERKAEEELHTEEEAYQPRNVYWVWLKRTLWLLCGYTLATTGYVAAKRAYLPNAYFLPFELDPFHAYGLAACEKIEAGYDFLFSPPVRALLPPRPPLKTEAHKKTLVLNFEGVLYAKDFKAGDGLVIHLRPGFYKFMQQIMPHYEVLLYSKEDTNFMQEVIQTIDPTSRYFPWFAGHEFMVWTPRGYRKDLKLVNRDLRRIIAVDFHDDIYINTADNVLLLDQYNGEESDNALRDLGAFLGHLANLPAKEARKEIQKYGGTQAVKNYAQGLQSRIDEQLARKDRFKKQRMMFH